MKQYSFLQEVSTYKKEETPPGVALGAAGTGMLASGGLSYATVRPVQSKLKKGNEFFQFASKELPDQLKGLKVNGTEKISDYMKRKGLSFTNGASASGPNFNPATNNIQLGVQDKHMGTWGKSLFAHELGHSVKLAKKGANLPGGIYTYAISKNLTGTMALGQLINCFNNDDESRQKIGKALSVAGGVSSIPMIAEEIGASIRGTKMLGLKGADKARAFAGIASYVTLALSPTIMYHVSETTRKFLKKLKKIKNENPQVQQNIELLKNQDLKVKI